MWTIGTPVAVALRVSTSPCKTHRSDLVWRGMATAGEHALTRIVYGPKTDDIGSSAAANATAARTFEAEFAYDGRRYLVSGELVEIDRAWHVSCLCIRRDDNGPIGTRARQLVPFARLEAGALAADLEGEPPRFRPPPEGARTKIDDTFLRQLSDRVVWLSATSKCPIKTLTEESGLSSRQSALQAWLRMARARGILPPSIHSRTYDRG
jgi:hypothetical protein